MESIEWRGGSSDRDIHLRMVTAVREKKKYKKWMENDEEEEEERGNTEYGKSIGL